ncbi:MAG: formate hydrogenlyase [Candidatus Peregrinibacteria bacterium]
MFLFSLLSRLFFGPRVTESPSVFNSVEPEDFETIGWEVKRTLQKLYGGRALKIRAVDAGSTNAEEIELTALNNAYYDVERFGLSFVASPKHADILFVTGPVTRNLEYALRATYDAMPQPALVVAIGDGACTGGIWNGSYAVVGAVENVIPVDYKIPGDPPSPTQILQGVLHLLHSASQL